MITSKQFAERTQHIINIRERNRLNLLSIQLETAKIRYDKIMKANGGKFDPELSEANKVMIIIEKEIAICQEWMNWNEHAKVGKGVSVCVGTDSHAYTIIEMQGSNRMVIQRDKAIPDSKLSNVNIALKNNNPVCANEQIVYSFERDSNGEIKIFNLRKSGRWVELGKQDQGVSNLLRGRREFYDYNY